MTFSNYYPESKFCSRCQAFKRVSGETYRCPDYNERLRGIPHNNVGRRNFKERLGLS